MSDTKPTRPDIESIRARCVAATEGPLDVREDRTNASRFRIVERAAALERLRSGSTAEPQYIATVFRPEDAALFASARSDLPALLAHVERLEALLRRVEFNDRDAEGAPFCGICNGYSHARACELAAILEGRPPPAESV